MSQERDHLPRVLIVTPEVTYLPDQLGSISWCLSAKAGGLADISASIVCELYDQGANVHIAIPNYRDIFGDCLSETLRLEERTMRRVLPEERLHLAEDHSFARRGTVYTGDAFENIRLSLAFQREVINSIIPRVDPDLIHCNDWMTGLIPAATRRFKIPSIFSVHNIHTMEILLSEIEDRGIDPTPFWQQLYFSRMPVNYDESRHTNPVDLLASGVFSADAVSVVSPTFLSEILAGVHDFISSAFREALFRKWERGMSAGILNAPDATFNPTTDPYLAKTYGPDDVLGSKADNKIAFQQALGLIEDPEAPMLFWPSRLDPVQKGCQLLSEILYQVISTYWQDGLQVVFVADGDYQQVFRDISIFHNLENRVAVHEYDPSLEHLGYGAADFVMMPSRYEPCGLPQMIGTIYGALPIAHAVGGLRDTVQHLNMSQNSGNGFLFETYDSGGLFWAIQEAMTFYRQPGTLRNAHIQRIMRKGISRFNKKVMADQYLALYTKLLKRPMIIPQSKSTDLVRQDSQGVHMNQETAT
jgi:starch synthase/alpha-amylase